MGLFITILVNILCTFYTTSINGPIIVIWFRRTKLFSFPSTRVPVFICLVGTVHANGFTIAFIVITCLLLKLFLVFLICPRQGQFLANSTILLTMLLGVFAPLISIVRFVILIFVSLLRYWIIHISSIWFFMLIYVSMLIVWWVVNHVWVVCYCWHIGCIWGISWHMRWNVLGCWRI